MENRELGICYEIIPPQGVMQQQFTPPKPDQIADAIPFTVPIGAVVA